MPAPTARVQQRAIGCDPRTVSKCEKNARSPSKKSSAAATISLAMATQTDSDLEAGTKAPAVIHWPSALQQNRRWLRMVVATRLRDQDAVEEVLQEVALAAVRQSAPLKDPAKVAPWLYRLAVRHVLLYRRKQGRRRQLLERYERYCPQQLDYSVSRDPLEWLLASERRRLVRVALARMPARDAEVLLLKYIENWSYGQIAAHLGVSHSAVESRLHRARARMRAELSAMNVVEVQP
jgi:RNA polymerase sigma-70 factor (ECF subfamily)